MARLAGPGLAGRTNGCAGAGGEPKRVANEPNVLG